MAEWSNGELLQCIITRGTSVLAGGLTWAGQISVSIVPLVSPLGRRQVRRYSRGGDEGHTCKLNMTYQFKSRPFRSTFLVYGPDRL